MLGSIIDEKFSVSPFKSNALDEETERFRRKRSVFALLFLHLLKLLRGIRDLYLYFIDHLVLSAHFLYISQKHNIYLIISKLHNYSSSEISLYTNEAYKRYF